MLILKQGSVILILENLMGKKEQMIMVYYKSIIYKKSQIVQISAPLPRKLESKNWPRYNDFKLIIAQAKKCCQSNEIMNIKITLLFQCCLFLLKY